MEADMTRTREEVERLTALAKSAEADDLIYRGWLRLDRLNRQENLSQFSGAAKKPTGGITL